MAVFNVFILWDYLINYVGNVHNYGNTRFGYILLYQQVDMLYNIYKFVNKSQRLNCLIRHWLKCKQKMCRCNRKEICDETDDN